MIKICVCREAISDSRFVEHEQGNSLALFLTWMSESSIDGLTKLALRLVKADGILTLIRLI